MEREKENAVLMEPKGNAPVEQDKLNDTKANAALMQTEERNIGAVTWEIYAKYLRFSGGLFWAPVIFLLLVVAQAAQGLNLTLYRTSQIH